MEQKRALDLLKARPGENARPVYGAGPKPRVNPWPADTETKGAQPKSGAGPKPSSSPKPPENK